MRFALLFSIYCLSALLTAVKSWKTENVCILGISLPLLKSVVHLKLNLFKFSGRPQLFISTTMSLDWLVDAQSNAIRIWKK